MNAPRKPRTSLGRALAVVAFVTGGAFALSACSPLGVAVGGAAAVGVAAAEDRGVGGAIDDGQIRLELNHLFFQHDLGLYADVNYTVREGRVLLTGKVKDPEHRVEAVRLAWQAAGVQEVINEIEVTDRSGLVDYGRDVWIATQLRSRLLFDADISAINYTVDVVNGTVYLMGIAQNSMELERAVNHARTLRHVRRVVSHVRVKDPESPQAGPQGAS